MWPEPVVESRTCYKCGAEFWTQNARLCKKCKKPRVSQRPHARKGQALTAREDQIMKLITDAASNKEIAAQLYLTIGTVKEYVNRLMVKTSVEPRNRTALAIWYRKYKGEETHG